MKSKVSKPMTISVEIVSYGENEDDPTKEILSTSDLEADLSNRKLTSGTMISKYMNTPTVGYSRSRILMSNNVGFELLPLLYDMTIGKIL